MINADDVICYRYVDVNGGKYNSNFKVLGTTES